MPEIRLILNPDVGGIEKVQVHADNEDDQMRTFKWLQTLMREINRFSQRIANKNYLEKVIGGEKEKPATADTGRVGINA